MVQIILRLSSRLIILFFIPSCTITVVDFNVAENRRTIYLDLNKDSIAEGNFFVECSNTDLIANGTYNVNGDSLKLLSDFSASIEGLKQDSITYSFYNYNSKSTVNFKTTSFAEFKKKMLDSVKTDNRKHYALYLSRVYTGGDTPPKDKLLFNYSISIANEHLNTSSELIRNEREVEGTMRWH